LHAKTTDEVKLVAGDFFGHRGYVEARSQHGFEFVFDKPSCAEIVKNTKRRSRDLSP